MLTARRVSLRAAFEPCRSLSIRQQRPAATRNPFRSRLLPLKSQGWKHEESHAERNSRKTYKAKEAQNLSLVEQLFPEETKRYEAQRQAQRHVPPLPLADLSNLELQTGPPRKDRNTKLSHNARRLRNEMEAAEHRTSVLVLRNASSNLTEEDFRRLIPQGKHLEGWTLAQGDILKVIPGRDLTTLAQQNVYFLLFSSPLSAFTYQGHVSRIHQLVATHVPRSILSPMPPPPGYLLEGLDIHAAIEAFSLVPPSQKLELRQLKFPLSPSNEALIQNQRSPFSMVPRKGKMPFEARLTLDGPQLSASMIQSVLMDAARDRGLSWSGSESYVVKIHKWDPSQNRRLLSGSGDRTDETTQSRNDGDVNVLGESDAHSKRRGQDGVFIVGFHTEEAAQSFIKFWHRRPMQWPVKAVGIGDEPVPIANVEYLW